MLGQLAAFLAIAALVIVTPGPDTALTISSTLRGGRRAGVRTALGVATGQAVWTVAASLGLAAVVAASEPAFRAIQLVGAAYLVALGARALVGALRHRSTGSSASTHGRPRRADANAFRQGLISNLANPKMVVFFTSLLPQFVGGEPSFQQLLPLGLLFCVLTFGWLTVYAVVVARAGAFLRTTRASRALDAVTGTVLVALGIRVASEQR